MIKKQINPSKNGQICIYNVSKGKNTNKREKKQIFYRKPLTPKVFGAIIRVHKHRDLNQVGWESASEWSLTTKYK